MKTNEELNALKEEFVSLSRKLSALTEAELTEVTGGGVILVGQDAQWHGIDNPDGNLEPGSRSGSKWIG